MSYTVLARRWRPQSLSDLIGQESVVRILTNALKQDRLHPALLFSGPRGTGKTSTARILAKNLNCPHIKDLNPCNSCKICKDIEESRSLDVIEIDGASHNGVEAVRQLKETITYLSSSAYKVYIIDEVHMLSSSAFNALLKTLEEPPSHVVFIMATTEIRKIPATVLSRCQILSFRKLVDSLIYEQLKKICKAEEVKTEEEALWLLVREAGGSMRDAQGFLDQMILFCDKEFNSKQVSETLGLTDRTLLLQSLKALLERNPQQILSVLEQLQIKECHPENFLKSLIQEIKNLILLKIPEVDLPTQLFALSEQEKQNLKKWAKDRSLEDLHFLMDMNLQALMDISRMQDPFLFLEMALLKMSCAPFIESLFGDSKSGFFLSEKIESTSSEETIQKTKQTESVKPAPSSVKTLDITKHPFVQKVQRTFGADILSAGNISSSSTEGQRKESIFDKNNKS